jgi:hypothetical protein
LAAAKEAGLKGDAKIAEYSSILEGVKRDFLVQIEGIAPSYREQTDKLKKKVYI